MHFGAYGHEFLLRFLVGGCTSFNNKGPMPVWSVVSGFIPYLIGVARIEKSWYLKLGQFDGTSTTRAGQMKWTTHEQAEPNRTFLVFVVGIFLKENFHVDRKPRLVGLYKGIILPSYKGLQ